MTAGHRRPPVLPRPVTGVFVRQIIHTACPGNFAVVWLDALPPAEDVLPDEGVELVDDLPAVCHRPGEPLPTEFTEAFANGFRQGWRSRGRGVPPYTVRVVLRDAVWHENDSNHWSFEQAGRVAAREVLDCVREGRSPPTDRTARPARLLHPSAAQDPAVLHRFRVRLNRSIRQGRPPQHGRPSVIAAVVAFLASPDSSFLLGANLYVDGGANQV